MENSIKPHMLAYKFMFVYFIMFFTNVKSQTVDVINPMGGYSIVETKCNNNLSGKLDDWKYECAFSDVMGQNTDRYSGYNPFRIAQQVNIMDEPG